MQTLTQNHRNTQSQDGVLAERFLTFHLAEEEFGIDIMRVQEIIGLVQITPVPTAPEYCRGVINLRGKVIPTIDFRKKLGMDPREDTERTCIIIVEVGGDKGQTLFGLVVDEVAEVLHVAETDLSPAPEYGGGLDNSLIQGVGVVDGKLKIFLDIERVLSGTPPALPGA